MSQAGRVSQPGRMSRLTPLFTALDQFATRVSKSLPPPIRRRWKPWKPSQVISAALAFGAVIAILAVLAPKVAHIAKGRYEALMGRSSPDTSSPIDMPAMVLSGSADARLDREGRSPCAGGLLFVLPEFTSDDGAFDLVVHFHGNVDLVEESYAKSKLDAVLVIMNFGIGSGAYESRYTNNAAFPDVLEKATQTMQKRGLRNAHVRRVALSAWSAGYGAVVRTIDQPQFDDKIDAVVLLDGIHAGYLADGQTIDPLRLEPFVRFAKLAADGKKLMTITHSNIVPLEYAGTRATTDAVLKAVGVTREDGGTTPPMPVLQAAVGVVAKAKLKPLEPVSHAEKNGLIVRGYSGETPEDHISHLLQMSETALPDLVKRWRAKE